MEEELLQAKIDYYKTLLENEKQHNATLKILVEILMEEIKGLTNFKENEYYNKEDIKRLFKCEDEKARAILKFAKQCDLATAVGNTTVISKENLIVFLDEYYKGNKISITY